VGKAMQINKKAKINLNKF